MWDGNSEGPIVRVPRLTREGVENGCQALHNGMEDNSEEQHAEGATLLRASSTPHEVAAEDEAGWGPVEGVDPTCGCRNAADSLRKNARWS